MQISLPHQVFPWLLQEAGGLVIDSDTDIDSEEEVGKPEPVAAAAEVKPEEPKEPSIPKMTAVKQVPALKPESIQAADMDWKRKYEELLAQVKGHKAEDPQFNSPIIQKVAFSPSPPPAAVSHSSPEETAVAKAKAPPPPAPTSAGTSPPAAAPTSESTSPEGASPEAAPTAEGASEIPLAEADLAAAFDMSAADTCLRIII